jgi:hypothetical protein
MSGFAAFHPSEAQPGTPAGPAAACGPARGAAAGGAGGEALVPPARAAHLVPGVEPARAAQPGPRARDSRVPARTA